MIRSVGILRTLNLEAVMGLSSTFNLAILTWPDISAASSSRTGAIARHGPHQGAHISNKTGNKECSTSVAKVESVTVNGREVVDRVLLQRPQTGSWRGLTRSASTRFCVPQDRHRMTCLSGIAVNNVTQTITLRLVGISLLNMMGVFDEQPGLSALPVKK